MIPTMEKTIYPHACRYRGSCRRPGLRSIQDTVPDAVLYVYYSSQSVEASHLAIIHLLSNRPL